MKAKTLETWVWVLLYGGLLMACFGVFVRREIEPLGHTMLTVGGLSALIGVLLIFVRSRMKDG